MTSKTPSDKVAVIAIDDTSIQNIGRWPWPRDVQAKLIDQLVAAKARVIGNTIFYFEPQKDPGLAYVEKMLDVYNKAYAPPAAPEIPAFRRSEARHPRRTPAASRRPKSPRSARS
jgi:serine/threonine-protein kinase